MPLIIIRQDISKVKADAIVNTANTNLLQGSGTSRAIYRAAGEELLTKACEELGYCDMGKAVITKGFNLPAKYIIHAVGPVWKKGKFNEKELLYSAYTESMKLAKQYQLKSIAFPLISTGFCGYPKVEALDVAKTAIEDFLKENDMEVYLTVYDEKSFQISKELFDSVEAYIDEYYVNNNNEKYVLDEDNENIDNLDFLINSEKESFAHMLFRLIDEKGMTDVETYKKANLSRKLFSKIRSNINYKPNKKTVFSFAIALELGIDETKSLLQSAGYAFSNNSKMDIVIAYFIKKKNYDIYEINNTLFKYDLPMLGGV